MPARCRPAGILESSEQLESAGYTHGRSGCFPTEQPTDLTFPDAARRKLSLKTAEAVASRRVADPSGEDFKLRDLGPSVESCVIILVVVASMLLNLGDFLSRLSILPVQIGP